MKANIKQIVLYHIKKFDTHNPFELADYLNIEYLIGPLGSRCGCYMYLKRHRCIFLNENLSDTEMQLVMSHELGHAILHRKQNCYFIRNKTLLSVDKIEKEANSFAAELLIPDEELSEYIQMSYSIEQIARIYGYSKELIELKF
ncbi:MAG: ImmA/IrrE family metallo-endopeptidase [Firmicutes bacterium]|nr:ImmA/IrrE family metallo-endopeptidase [Bacillota bacterium]